LTRTQKNLSGFENRRSIAETLDEQFGGPSNGLIIINYRDQIAAHSEFPADSMYYSEEKKSIGRW
jgi:hypothetical protein